MLTIDFDRFQVSPGDRLLDLGCGAGRHTFEALRRGADVVALDRNAEDLAAVEATVAELAAAGHIPRPDGPVTTCGDALALPFDPATFDRVLASEILEHIPEDRAAIAEIVRVAKPGGLVAVSVPRRWPEQVCWRLSDAYHEVEGGHVRIYRGHELLDALTSAGLVPLGTGYAHALHSPYWWLKCAVGVSKDHPSADAYHKMLVWDIMKRPRVT
ncbi:MAG: class I SAM-dependent methyltransferase, partial [Mycobacteriales bacterium]